MGPQFQADLNILHLNRHCDKSKCLPGAPGIAGVSGSSCFLSVGGVHQSPALGYQPCPGLGQSQRPALPAVPSSEWACPGNHILAAPASPIVPSSGRSLPAAALCPSRARTVIDHFLLCPAAGARDLVGLSAGCGLCRLRDTRWDIETGSAQHLHVAHCVLAPRPGGPCALVPLRAAQRVRCLQIAAGVSLAARSCLVGVTLSLAGWRVPQHVGSAVAARLVNTLLCGPSPIQCTHFLVYRSYLGVWDTTLGRFCPGSPRRGVCLPSRCQCGLHLLSVCAVPGWCFEGCLC